MNDMPWAWVREPDDAVRIRIDFKDQPDEVLVWSIVTAIFDETVGRGSTCTISSTSGYTDFSQAGGGRVVHVYMRGPEGYVI